MKRVSILTGLVIFLIFFQVKSAQAILVWDWLFEPSDIVAGPNESVNLNIRLINDASSDENFSGDRINGLGIGTAGTQPDYYDVIFPSESSDLFNFDLAPGEDTTKVFFQLFPKSSIPLGAVWSAESEITLDDQAQGDGISSNVRISIPTPEPSTMLLLGISLSGLYVRKKKLFR